MDELQVTVALLWAAACIYATTKDTPFFSLFSVSDEAVLAGRSILDKLFKEELNVAVFPDTFTVLPRSAEISNKASDNKVFLLFPTMDITILYLILLVDISNKI